VYRAAWQGARLRVLWAALLVVGTGVLLAGAYGAASKPGCDSCHDGRAFLSATVTAPHAKVACASCHLDTGAGARLAFGLSHVTAVALPADDQGRDRAFVPDTRCVSCHSAVAKRVVASNGIKIAHATCTVDRTCTDCHSSVAHGTATSWVSGYDMETCLACHASKASTDCDACHEGRTRADRVTTGVFATTHGPEWKATHGMGNAATCSVCHTAASCGTCHGPGLPHQPEFLDEHAAVSARPEARCATCHEPAFCGDCHGLDMPHPKRFTRTHAKAAGSDSALCRRCHVSTDCTTCHEKHIHPGGAVGSLEGVARKAANA